MQRFDVLGVGAGFCGLGLAASLRAAGVERFAILERGDDVGHFWAGNYDRITLHSPWHALPHDGGLTDDYPMYKPRDGLLDYFRRYVELHRVRGHFHFGTTLERARRDGAEWSLATDRGEYRAPFLAVATSANREPVVPALPGAERFRGVLRHTRDYRNGAPFRGQRVLVVGSGNSAAEVSLDLAEHGAAEVAMWVRAPRHFIPIEEMRKAALFAKQAGLAFDEESNARAHTIHRGHPEFLPQLAARDEIFGKFSVDLSDHGVRRPELGPMTEMYAKLRVPVFDQGTIAAIRDGRVRIVDGNERPIDELTPDGVVLGGGEEPFDAVLLGTGFEPRLDDLLEDAGSLLAPDPDFGQLRPRTDGRCRSRVEPSLFFPGLDITVQGGLSMGLWGWEVGETLARELGSASG